MNDKEEPETENIVDFRIKNNERSNSITEKRSDTRDTTKMKNFTQASSLEGISIKLMSYCSRFSSCDAPKCPLDPLIEMRSNLEGNDRCEMAKATRHRYWESMPEDIRKYLPYEGYFKAEFSRIRTSHDRWDKLPPEEKSRIIEMGKKALSRAKEVLK